MALADNSKFIKLNSVLMRQQWAGNRLRAHLGDIVAALQGYTMILVAGPIQTQHWQCHPRYIEYRDTVHYPFRSDPIRSDPGDFDHTGLMKAVQVMLEHYQSRIYCPIRNAHIVLQIIRVYECPGRLPITEDEYPMILEHCRSVCDSRQGDISSG
jgi:hypothetical protein